MSNPIVCHLSPPQIRHARRHDIKFEYSHIIWKTCDVDNGIRHVLHVKCGLRDHTPVRLKSTLGEPRC